MKQVANTCGAVFISLFCVALMAPLAGAAPKALSQKELLRELTGKEALRQNAVSLYAEMVGAYQSNDEVGLKRRLQSFQSQFPQSEFADNALYLASRMAMDRRNYAEALKYFAAIQKQYPQGDKVAAATFAKGMAYKQMKLPKLAEQVLTSVRKKYPGSPEAFRAESEIKILK